MAWNEPGGNSNNQDPWVVVVVAVVVAVVTIRKVRLTWMKLFASCRTA